MGKRRTQKTGKAPCGGGIFSKVNCQESSKLQSEIRRKEISMLVI